MKRYIQISAVVFVVLGLILKAHEYFSRTSFVQAKEIKLLDMNDGERIWGRVDVQLGDEETREVFPSALATKSCGFIRFEFWRRPADTIGQLKKIKLFPDSVLHLRAISTGKKLVMEKKQIAKKSIWKFSDSIDAQVHEAPARLVKYWNLVSGEFQPEVTHDYVTEHCLQPGYNYTLYAWLVRQGETWNVEMDDRSAFTNFDPEKL